MRWFSRPLILKSPSLPDRQELRNSLLRDSLQEVRNSNIRLGQMVINRDRRTRALPNQVDCFQGAGEIITLSKKNPCYIQCQGCGAKIKNYTCEYCGGTNE